MAVVQKTLTYGLNAGTPFPEYTTIKSLSLSTGTFVDRIVINGDAYGGPGGTPTATITLDDDEYLANVTLRSGDVLDSLRLSTNKGKSINGGGQGGALHCALFQGRVLGISGMVGYWHGFALPVISRLTLRVEMPDPPHIKDDCSKW